MRAIAAGAMIISLSIAVVGAAAAQQRAQAQPSYGDMPAPAGHRQPTSAEITGADQVKSEESASAKAIKQENERLDRLIRSICRGC
jgi:hypothetical protein